MITTNEETLQRCADVWYDDGTVVLQAENTVFKVYRGVLKEQSLFFKDLFTLPLPESDQSEKYEGCPLVTLHDKAVEVHNFLKAIFDPEFYFELKAVTDCNIVVSVMKLSDKYHAEHLLHRSLPLFLTYYPATLRNWDTRVNRRHYKPLINAYGKALPIFVVQLARKTGTDILLPSALLECCGFSDAELLHGVPSPEGEMFCLAADDQAMVLRAREKLVHIAEERLAPLVRSANAAGTKRDATAWGWLLYLREFWAELWEQMRVGESKRWVNPLAISLPMNNSRGANTRLNRAGVDRMYRNARQGIWNELPAMFDLLPWDRMKRESIKK